MIQIFDELNNSNIHETITYQDIVKSIGGRKACYNKSSIYHAIKQATKTLLKKPKAFTPSKELLIKHRDSLLENRTVLRDKTF
jgi:hypothetical protein